MISLEQLKDRIRDKYDPDELVDLLEITNEDIFHYFEHRILLYRERFVSEEYWEDEDE